MALLRSSWTRFMLIKFIRTRSKNIDFDVLKQFRDKPVSEHSTVAYALSYQFVFSLGIVLRFQVDFVGCQRSVVSIGRQKIWV